MKSAQKKVDDVAFYLDHKETKATIDGHDNNNNNNNLCVSNDKSFEIIAKMQEE